MTRHVQRLLPLLFIALSACSTSQGFDRVAMQDTLHQRMPLLSGTSEANTAAATNAAGSRLSFTGPFRLGIYFIRSEFPTRQSVQSGEWLSAEQDRLAHRLASLRDERILRDVVVLAEPTVRTLSIQELRQTAGRYGIDILLLIDGVGAVDRYNNNYALLYPTILGAWLAPGTISDALFVIDGALLDLRTGTVLDRYTAEGQAQRTGAAVLVEDAGPLKDAKGLAIDAFGEKLVARLRSLAGKPSGDSSPLR